MQQSGEFCLEYFSFQVWMKVSSLPLPATPPMVSWAHSIYTGIVLELLSSSNFCMWMEVRDCPEKLDFRYNPEARFPLTGSGLLHGRVQCVSISVSMTCAGSPQGLLWAWAPGWGPGHPKDGCCSARALLGTSSSSTGQCLVLAIGSFF